MKRLLFITLALLAAIPAFAQDPQKAAAEAAAALTAAPDAPKVVEKPVYIEKPAEPAAVAAKEPLRRDIFFTINSTVITPAEKQKVEEVVAYMKKYPEAKVSVTGYADKGTGNASINARLGKNRAKTVVDTLVQQYGIDASRITSDSKGDTVQPFAENDKNRVSICIAE